MAAEPDQDPRQLPVWVNWALFTMLVLVGAGSVVAVALLGHGRWPTVHAAS